MKDEDILALRMKNLEDLVRQAVPAVRGHCKTAEKKAAYDQRNAPTYFLMHLDRAVMWRAWLNQAEMLLPGLAATMPEDHLEDFHNRNDVMEIARLRAGLMEFANDRSDGPSRRKAQEILNGGGAP